MKVKGLRWYIISLIGLATIINYIDRSAINIMWPYIYNYFGIAEADSKNSLALITTFFMVAYAIGQSATGKLMDAIGTRFGMAISIFVWSVSIALHATARSITSFSFFRFFLGLSEAGNWPGATKSNAEWFPVKERAIAQGIFNAGAALGSVISAPVIAWLFVRYGWRITFVMIAVLGLFWIIPWLVVNKASPGKHPWMTKTEHEHILDNKPAEDAIKTKAQSWKSLLSYRKTWGLVLSRFFIDPVWWLFVTWLPTFLNEQFHFNIKQIGAFAWVPYLFAAIGSLVGGYYSSYQIRKGVEPVVARKRAVLIGCGFMLLSLSLLAFYLNNLKEQPGVAIALISVTLFGFQFLIGNIQTLPSDYFKKENVGTVAGMAGTAAVVGTLVTTWIVPVITKTSYVSFFVLAAVLVPLSWLSIHFITSKKQIQSI